VALIAYGVIVFPSTVGLNTTCSFWIRSEVDLLGHPRFRPSLGPWLWFKLYWAAWAMLLAVAEGYYGGAAPSAVYGRGSRWRAVVPRVRRSAWPQRRWRL